MVRAGGSVILSSGCYQHQVGLLFWKDLLVIADKGIKGYQPVRVYRVNRQKMTPAIMDKIHDQVLHLQPQAYQYLHGQLISDLKGERALSVEREILKLWPGFSVQLVGNCSMENLNAALQALVVLEMSDSETAKSKRRAETLYFEIRHNLGLKMLDKFTRGYMDSADVLLAKRVLKQAATWSSQMNPEQMKLAQQLWKRLH